MDQAPAAGRDQDERKDALPVAPHADRDAVLLSCLKLPAQAKAPALAAGNDLCAGAELYPRPASSAGAVVA
jgi:hypothetical protein